MYSEYEQLLEAAAVTVDHVVTVLKVMGIDCENVFRPRPRAYDTNPLDSGSLIDFKNQTIRHRETRGPGTVYPIDSNILQDIRNMIEHPKSFGPTILLNPDGELTKYVVLSFQFAATGFVCGYVWRENVDDEPITFDGIEDLILILTTGVGEPTTN